MAHRVEWGVGTDGGVVWNASGLLLSGGGDGSGVGGTIDWTVFPSTGLLLPGSRCACERERGRERREREKREREAEADDRTGENPSRERRTCGTTESNVKRLVGRRNGGEDRCDVEVDPLSHKMEGQLHVPVPG